jgi:hypothetical protein
MFCYTVNDALKRLRETAEYRHPLLDNCFRREVANEANRKLKYVPTSSSGIHHVSRAFRDSTLYHVATYPVSFLRRGYFCNMKLPLYDYSVILF